MTFSGNGPGTGNIFMRGLGGVGSGNQSQSTTAPFPNVALYLDDQSMQFPARNNDVYLVDMERVEILEGPQGTLFGGGAQAGAIRYITNKPKLDATSGEVNAGYGITAGGDPNTSCNAVLNLPLIDDNLALRGVIFSERRGGYIDNVPSTIGYYPGHARPHDCWAAIRPPTTARCSGNNLEPGRLHTVRACRRCGKINDNWDIAAAAELPEHGGGRLLLRLPDRHRTAAAGQLPDQCVRAGLQQGRLREHGLDRERQDRAIC